MTTRSSATQLLGAIAAAMWLAGATASAQTIAKPDDVDLLLPCRGNDFFGRHHHAEVGHLVVVTREHHADDVLADVVHIALHGGEKHAADRVGLD